MKLIIASNNKHKTREIREILSPFFSDITTMGEAGINVDPEETGETFRENALIKAEATAKLAKGCAVLADDSGLMVDALGGAPGVHSARYCGEAHNDAANNDKLITELACVPDDKRTARFVTSLALLIPGKKPVYADGAVEGRILNARRGENGFGYDPLFFYPPLNKSFAELSPDEKNMVSHRSRALSALREALSAEHTLL